MLDRLFLLEPVTRGILQALASVLVASLGGAFALSTLPAASPGLLQNVALIGAALVIAYAIEATWLAQRAADAEDAGDAGEEYQEWLGFITGAGIAGLTGIVAALLVAEHLTAGNESFLDDLGTAWAAVSLAILAVVIVIQPLLANRLRPSE